MLKNDALNFVKYLIKTDAYLTWNQLSSFTAEIYANVNRQKQILDRLHSLRFGDFETSGEYPATTIKRITTYIDKHVPIALDI